MSERIRKRVELPMMERAEGSFVLDGIDMDARTVPITFSSEIGVTRQGFFDPEPWTEILGHGDGEVRMQRLNDHGALHMDHDTRDLVAVVERAEIGDGKGRALVRFGESQRAEEVFRDVIGGIRTGISVGYRVHEYEEMEEDADRGMHKKKSQKKVMRAVDWEPFELSLTSIPADASVGVGTRSSEDELRNECVVVWTRQEERADRPVITVKEERTVPKEDTTPTPATPDLDKIRAEAATEERERVTAIRMTAEKFGKKELGEMAVEQNRSVADFNAEILKTASSPQEHVRSAMEEDGRDPKIGMDERQISDFRIVKLIRAQLENDHKIAPLEWELSEAAAEKADHKGRYRDNGNLPTMTIPFDVFDDQRFNRYSGYPLSTRDAIGKASPGTEGAALIETQLLGSSYIDLLRARTTMAGEVTLLPGLVGDIDIPKMSAGATAYWVGEDTDITVDNTTAFLVVNLSPKTVGIDVPMTRRMLLQSTPAVEGLVRNEIIARVAVELDRVLIDGGGSNEPTGIMSASGLNSVPTAGAAGGPITWAHILEHEQTIADAFADTMNLKFLVNPKVRKHLKETTKGELEDRFLWDSREFDSPLNGYSVIVSNHIINTYAEAGSGNVLSGMAFGDFSTVVCGMWGGLDLTVDPWTDVAKGGLHLRVFQDIDVEFRTKQSINVTKDIDAS